MKLQVIPSNEEFVVKSITHPDKDMSRRLIDLGFFKDAIVKKVLTSPKEDPIAYRVRGTTIALRNSDAQYIEVEKNGKD